MKITIPTTKVKDIGPLDQAMRLPNAGRKRIGRKTTCNRCGKAITEDYFIGGFKKGLPNMMFHESCWDGSGERIGDW